MSGPDTVAPAEVVRSRGAGRELLAGYLLFALGVSFVAALLAISLQDAIQAHVYRVYQLRSAPALPAPPVMAVASRPRHSLSDQGRHVKSDPTNRRTGRPGTGAPA